MKLFILLCIILVGTVVFTTVFLGLYAAFRAVRNIDFGRIYSELELNEPILKNKNLQYRILKSTSTNGNVLYKGQVRGFLWWSDVTGWNGSPDNVKSLLNSYKNRRYYQEREEVIEDIDEEISPALISPKPTGKLVKTKLKSHEFLHNGVCKKCGHSSYYITRYKLNTCQGHDSVRRVIANNSGDLVIQSTKRL